MYVEIFSIVTFIIAWVGYGWLVTYSPYSANTLNMRMDDYRRRWMLQMLDREPRILDGNIMSSLQNGSAFFASTSLIALGAALTLLRSSEEALTIVSSMPFTVLPTKFLWEVKVLGLVIILAYAFFKFAWSYRILNYAAILIGATPDPRKEPRHEAMAVAEQATRMLTMGGRHFNRGQRAIFFALAYLGWFISGYALLATTICVVGIMANRQFGSSRDWVFGKPTE